LSWKYISTRSTGFKQLKKMIKSPTFRFQLEIFLYKAYWF